MIKYPNFTREQWREIDDARDRLATYKNKIQPYPALSEEKEVLPVISPEHRLYGGLQQLNGQFVHLKNQYNEHLDKSRRSSNKYNIYK